MNDPFAPHAFVGSAPPNLVGERPVAGRFGSKRRADWTPPPASDDLYASGFAAGVRATQDQLHGNALWALAVGSIAGTAAGVFYRELGMAVGSMLGY